MAFEKLFTFLVMNPKTHDVEAAPLVYLYLPCCNHNNAKIFVGKRKTDSPGSNYLSRTGSDSTWRVWQSSYTAYGKSAAGKKQCEQLGDPSK